MRYVVTRVRAARVGRSGAVSVAVLLTVLACGASPVRVGAEPCADAVVDYVAGTNGGFQEDLLPDIVLGPPFGAGTAEQSLDVASLGDGGSITLAFEDNQIVDGPGVDFTVFENAFGGVTQPVFIEVGVVSVSADGATFLEMPHDPNTFAGLAGVTPVFSHPDNGIDPRDPSVSGGDGFDLAAVGLTTARFVRIDDPGTAIHDPGNDFPTPGLGKSGFDLDAVVAVHSADTCAGCCDADGNGRLTPGDVLLLLRDVSELSLPINPCGEAPCRSVHCGDADDSGALAPNDVLLCLELVSELPTAITPCATGLCDFAP